MKGEQLQFFSRSQETEKRHCYLVSLENICICAVFVVVMTVVSFILGIEKGKKLVPGNAATTAQASQPFIAGYSETGKTLAPAFDYTSQPTREEIKDTEARSAAAGENTGIKAVDTAAVEKFTIQVASFKDRKSADRESEELKNSGYPTNICKKGDYLVIFVGEYSTKQAARPCLEKLRDRYKDCYIRRL